jgi:hypothetical protein
LSDRIEPKFSDSPLGDPDAALIELESLTPEESAVLPPEEQDRLRTLVDQHRQAKKRPTRKLTRARALIAAASTAAVSTTTMQFHQATVARGKTIWGWLTRYERSLSALGMIGGFAFDNYNFRRIDLPNTQAVFIGYLTLTALCMFLSHLFVTRHNRSGKLPPRWAGLLPVAAQFALGALWSAFLVFYSRGAVLAQSWPFLLVLAAIFLGNELFKHYHSRLAFTATLFFFGLFSYAIVTTPILTRNIGPLTFILSGALALTIFYLFLRTIRWIGRVEWKRARVEIFFGSAAVYAALNFFYFIGALPPLPLAMADSGVYHFVARVGDVYQAQGETQPWFTRFGQAPVLHVAAGQPLYVYSAVFAPIRFSVNVIHRWEHYNRLRKKWMTVGRIAFAINGGRDGGYRNYTIQHKVWDGDWRVDVDTTDGRIIGRIPFSVHMVPQPIVTIPVVLK